MYGSESLWVLVCLRVYIYWYACICSLQNCTIPIFLTYTNKRTNEQITHQPTPTNPHQKKVAHWSTHEEGKGVLPLRVGDVLMEVDGLAVDDTGVVAMPPHRLQVGGGMGGWMG